MRKKRRIFRRLLTLTLLVILGAGAWAYMKPYLTADSVTSYARYTVKRGNVETTKSFSATLSVGDSETLYNTTEAESIKKLYVTGGQEVREGDLLMELSDGTVLEAGIDGMVNEIRYSEGDWLRRNVQLVEICDLENLKVSLQIDEYDVEQMAAGQKCTIMIVPLNRTYETELTHVSRLSSGAGRVAYYSATAELAVPDDVLPGMTASVSMPDASALDVLTLEMAALSFDDDGKPYVLKKTGDNYEPVYVETGLSDGMTVEIVSGLKDGEEVWAAAGTEEVASAFSMTEIYKKIFGQTVVINEERGAGSRTGQSGFSGGRGSRDRGNVASMTDMAFPEGMTIPEGMTMPEGMPDGRSKGGMASMTDMPGGQRQRPDNADNTERTGRDGV